MRRRCLANCPMRMSLFCLDVRTKARIELNCRSGFNPTCRAKPDLQGITASITRGRGRYTWLRGWAFLLVPKYRRERRQVWREKKWTYAAGDIAASLAVMGLEIAVAVHVLYPA